MKVRRVKVLIKKETDLKNVAGETKYGIYEFNYPETSIEFRVNYSEEDTPSSSLVKIYGADRNTFSLLKTPQKGDYSKVQYVEIYYGYDDNLELVYRGVVNRTMYAFENGNQTLTFLIDHNTNKFFNLAKTISFADKTSLGEALNIVKSKYEYNVYASGEINKGISIGRFSFVGTVGDCLKEFLPKDYGYKIDVNDIYVYKKSKEKARYYDSTLTDIVLSMDSGLLSYPTFDSNEEKVSIKSTLLPSVEAGVTIKVPVDEVWFIPEDKGMYRSFSVLKYNTSFQNGLGTTEMECEEIDK